MSNKRFDILNRIDEIPSASYLVLGILFLTLHTVVCKYTAVSPTSFGILCIFLYLVSAGIVWIFLRKKIAIYRAEAAASDEQNSGVIAAFRDLVYLPYAIVSENGRVITVNASMREITGSRDAYFNLDVAELLGVNTDELIRSADEDEPEATNAEGTENSDRPAKKTPTVTIGANRFEVFCYPVRTNGHSYYMIVMNDITKLTEITDRHYAQTPAVAYIVIDNLDQIAQYLKGSYRDEANEVEKILKAFAEEMDGVIREYDRDKYVMFFDRKHLNACIKDKFSILDAVRQIHIGDDEIPVTISMGIAITGETLAEREHDALTALDLALQRGGDQAVVKNEKGVNFFGSLTKTQQKRTRVHSRIIANKLHHEIANASNILVMGHRAPDFDSIGACVGIATLAMHYGANVKIVTDTRNASFLACTEGLLELEEYKNVFVDAVDGLGEFNYNTLLIVVDANNFSILEAPEIAEKSNRTIVIDHHIKKEEFKVEPALSYIDPSASSACELVSEILEQSLPAGTLTKEEATILLSGIMVDTKNFTRTVGTRTFSAALYLRAAGANTEVARTFFDEAFEDYRAEALFRTEVEIYRSQIAITMSEGTGSAQDRIAAAKAADKLLTVKGVNAAFALVKVGEIIHISARSNGSINVQLVLERIGGGGHFDMAGAAVSGRTLAEAKTILIDAINKQLDETAKK